MLIDEFNYFIEHQDELVRQNQGKVIVIKDNKVIGVFESAFQAFMTIKETHPVGSFLIQNCDPGSEAYTTTISSTVVA